VDVGRSIIDGDYEDARPDGTLGPSESLDSDQVRNDDGDVVIYAPLRWISSEDHVTLDGRLAAQEPEFGYTEGPPPRRARRRRQIGGSAHEGPPFVPLLANPFSAQDPQLRCRRVHE
jgi:hypothetical protein